MTKSVRLWRDCVAEQAGIWRGRGNCLLRRLDLWYDYSHSVINPDGEQMKFIAAAALATTLLTAVPAGAVTIAFQDDFSGYGGSTLTNAPDSTFDGNWTTTSGTVDYLASGDIFGDLCPPTTNCVDLDGSTNAGGTFQTTQVFKNGYFNVLFQFSGSNREGSLSDSLIVSFGGVVGTVTKLFNQVGNQTDFGLMFTNVFVGSAGTVLSFADGTIGGSDNQGIILKNVTVELAAVPVPAAGGLLVLALGGLAALRRRKAALV